MAYNKRYDGRKFEELRPMSAELGVIKQADGSARFTIGDTVAVAAVYGPRNVHPKFKQNPQKGIIRANYDMISFSVTERKRPGPSRRSSEISLVTENSLLPSVDLTQFPTAGVDIFIQITQANAGTRCAGITAASMALAHAGIPMRDLVYSVSAGKVSNKIVIDLDKKEEDHPEGATDIPLAFCSRSKEVTLLQVDGNITKDELMEAIELGKKAGEEIYKLQKETLKGYYKK